MNNLKLALTELDQRLQKELKWQPGNRNSVSDTSESSVNTTQPIIDFISFLNNNPQAVYLLKDFNIEWGSNNENKNVPDSVDDIFKNEVLGPACKIDDPGCISCE